MAHHRCTRCKQESYPRHKYGNGIYCEDCIREIRHGYRPSSGSWLGSLWGKIVGLAQSVFHFESSGRVKRERERASYSRMKTMEARARRIPPDPQSGLQKH